MKKKGGFTLVEILVVALLMTIIIGSVAVVFSQTSFVVTYSQTRLEIYTQARYALDRLEMDIKNLLPFRMGKQRFYIKNGVITLAGISPNHWYGAADELNFISTTRVGAQIMVARIRYYLKSDTSSITGKPIYILIREVWIQDQSGNWVPATDMGYDVFEEEVCRAVISFNIEFHTEVALFSQSGNTNQTFTEADPLGDDEGDNDTTNPLTIRSLRVTLIVIDEGDLTERVFSQMIYIPASS
jgi:type II secretory pathway pseudopilin PulG